MAHDRRGADQTYRTFTESLRFPAPAAGRTRCRYASTSATRKQAFQPLWETKLDTDGHVRRPHRGTPQQTLIALEQHGAPADKVDLLLLGDGYTAARVRGEVPRPTPSA